MRNQVGKVLVVGGGVAGIQVALDLADLGFMSIWWGRRLLLVE